MVNEDEFRDVMDFFDSILNEVSREIANEMFYMGYCNCCFQKTKGQFVHYRYEDGEVVPQLFICQNCIAMKCNPEGDCKIKGVSCNYVTKKN